MPTTTVPQPRKSSFRGNPVRPAPAPPAKETQPTLYQDAMDASRVIRVLRMNGTRFEGKVFWRDRKGTLHFGGRVSIPASLFGNDQRTHCIGFYPLDAAGKPAVERPRFPRHKASNPRNER